MKEGALWRHPSSSKFWNNDSSIANSEYTGIHSWIESLNLIGREDNCPITVIGCNDLSTGSHNARVHYCSLRVYYQWWIITDDSCNSVEARITIRCRVLISRKIVIGSKLTQNILEGIEIFSSKISQLRKVINYSLDLATSNVLFSVGHFSPLGTALVFYLNCYVLKTIKNS